MVTLTINDKDTVETSLKVGEIDNPKITFTSNGEVVDLSAATLKIIVKLESGGSAVLTILDGEMNKADAVNGIVYFPLDTTSGFSAGEYVYDIFIVQGVTSITYTPTIHLKMIEPITE